MLIPLASPLEREGSNVIYKKKQKTTTTRSMLNDKIGIILARRHINSRNKDVWGSSTFSHTLFIFYKNNFIRTVSLIFAQN